MTCFILEKYILTFIKQDKHAIRIAEVKLNPQYCNFYNERVRSPGPNLTVVIQAWH